MDFGFEIVVLPASDRDRAKGFYQALRWREDADLVTGPSFRVVQLTPPADHATYGSFLSFADPDGNLWFGQEVTTRLPGRVTAADGIPGGGT